MIRAKPSDAPAKKPSKAAKPTRAERSSQTREALFDAAAKIVGKVGYPDAQISAITTEANVAHGTFYNYFESRQDLFDQLLPVLGTSMLERIQHASGNAASDLERESKSFRAFFDFLLERPEFYRILFEARVYCPEAYDQHQKNVSTGYVRVLGRALERGEIQGIEKDELEALAFILMGAREYIALRYARSNGQTKRIPERVAELYDKLVARALYGTSAKTKRNRG